MESRWFARIRLTATLVVAAVLACGCGGSGDGSGIGGDAGVDNGSIRGQILGAAGPGEFPIDGAVVTALRQDSPPITRFVRTDSNGVFVFPDLPLGNYTIAVQAIGFSSVNPGDGAAPQVFVESGSESDLPPIILGATFAPGSANLIVTVLDAVTGDAVTDATVSAGVATSTSPDGSGVYPLSVPLGAQASPVSVPLAIEASGYAMETQTPTSVLLAPGQLVAVTARMTPQAATITGDITIQSGQGALLSAGLLSTVSLMVANVPSSFSQPQIDPVNATFTVQVPASTSTQPRAVTLVFSSPNFAVATVPGLIAPQAGSRTLVAPIVLRPIGVTVTGTVINSSGQLGGASPVDQVTIVELGISTPIVGGAYAFTNVPVGIPLTIQATVANPFHPLNPVETASTRITLTSTPDGTFTVPMLETH